MLDCLQAPDAGDDYGELTKAIAVCHLEENLDNFITYYDDRQLLARAVRRYLGPSKAADRLVALMRENFLDVSTGYSDDMQEEYKKDPAALQKNPRHTTGVKRVASTVRT
jgi:hypothetical protein